ncbi:hypothetical protein D9613_008737 [Agrocybe pediades]|uniref:Transmembrane protein n=1 Tax=Agrocybe pediades TaxID=84607 RepID=A0A8H4QSK7_9AGAR|nr:hypothetical protein D9613_008737 [Agrocybe pediades]
MFTGSQYARPVLLFFGLLGATIVTMDAVHVKWVVCVGSPGSKTAESLLAIFMVVYESLSAICTTYRGWRALHSNGELESQKCKLQYVLVKQGVLYFCFVSIFTLGALILLNTAPNGSFIQRLLNALTLPISGLMTARFILHLREWDDEQHGRDVELLGATDPINFCHTEAPRDEEEAEPMSDNNNITVEDSGSDTIIQERRSRQGSQRARSDEVQRQGQRNDQQEKIGSFA